MTIDELLKNLQRPKDISSLSNTRQTWERLGNNDSFSELGLEGSALQDFLKEWIKDNEYSNI